MAEETQPENNGGGKKKSPLFQGKNKYWVIGGAVLVLGILFVAVRSANKSSNASSNDAQDAASTAAQNGINPSTGYLYGSPADIAAQGGSESSGTIPVSVSGTVTVTGTTPTPTPLPAKNPPTKVSGKPIISKKPAPKPVAPTYTVKAGDNLSKIAAKYHTTWQHLYSLNKHAIGSNPNLIHPGLRLKI